MHTVQNTDDPRNDEPSAYILVLTFGTLFECDTLSYGSYFLGLTSWVWTVAIAAFLQLANVLIPTCVALYKLAGRKDTWIIYAVNGLLLFIVIVFRLVYLVLYTHTAHNYDATTYSGSYPLTTAYTAINATWAVLRLLAALSASIFLITSLRGLKRRGSITPVSRQISC